MSTLVKPRPKKFIYSEEAMQAACRSVRVDKKKVREAARLYGVPPSTLADRIKGKIAFHEVQRTVIMASEEERLVNWIKESARRGFGRTMKHVQQAVQNILNQRNAVTVFNDNLPGRKWVYLFLKRHRDITLRTPQALGAQRAAVTESKLRSWFEEARREIQSAGGDILDHPSRIFNCDETGFQLGVGGIPRVLAKKGEKHVYQVSTDTHPQITVLACVSASGEVHNPLIIFPGQRFAYNPLEGFLEAHFARSNTGWIDADIFTTWLEKAFIPATEHLPKPVLLFADGHKTHLTLNVSELCRDHGIILYQLPSQSSHIVQPLDLTAFKRLKQVWREEAVKFQVEYFSTVGKREFSAILKKAWERGMPKDTVISGFRAAGLYSWNPEHIDWTKLGPSRQYEVNSVTRTGPSKNTMATTVTTATESDSVTMTGPSTNTMATTETESNSVTMTWPSTNEMVTTETETDNVTMTGTSTNMKTKPSEMTGLVSGTTETDALTVTMTAEETMKFSNVHEDQFINPSPPTYPFVLPPLPISPLPSCATIATTSPSSSPAITPAIIGTVSSTSTSLSHRPVAATSSLTEMIGNISNKEAVDRLLDLAVKVGFDGLVQYRSLHTLGSETDSPEQRLFSLLYSRLTRPQTDTNSSGFIGPTFDNLPLPSQKKKQRLQPPKMVSSDAFRQYMKDVDEKKKKMKEGIESRRKERAEEEKERKRHEQERKKRLREEKNAEKNQKEKEKILKLKARKVTKSEVKKYDDNDTSDNVSTTSSKCVDDDSDMDFEMTNDDLCFDCYGEKDGEFFEGIGCDCGKWFHIGCLKDESLQGRSTDEIEKMTYICDSCKNL